MAENDPSITPDQQSATGTPLGGDNLKLAGAAAYSNIGNDLANSMRGPQGLGLLAAMMPQPMSNGQAYASALAGGVSLMRGQPNPVDQQYQRQVEMQQNAAGTMDRMMERQRQQDLKRNEFAFKVADDMMQSDDPKIRAAAVKTWAKGYSGMTGQNMDPETLNIYVKRGTKGAWQQDFIFDSQAKNEAGEPLYSPSTLAEKYGLTPQEANALVGRQRDPNYMRKTLGDKWKSPEELDDERIGRTGKRYENLSKLYPDLYHQPGLYSEANKHYRKETGSDLVTVIDDWKNPATRERANRAIELGKADLEQKVIAKEGRKNEQAAVIEDRRDERSAQRENARDARQTERLDRQEQRQAERDRQQRESGKLTTSQSARSSDYEKQGVRWVTRKSGILGQSPLSEQLASYTGATTDEREEILEYKAAEYAHRKRVNDPLFRGTTLTPPEKPDSVIKYEAYLTEQTNSATHARQQAAHDTAQPGFLSRLWNAQITGQAPAQPEPGTQPGQQQQPPSTAKPGTVLSPAKSQPSPAMERSTQPPGKVVVRSKEGELVTIPKENLKEAQRRGAVLVQ